MNNLPSDIMKLVINSVVNRRDVINLLSVNKLFRQYMYLFYERFFVNVYRSIPNNIAIKIINAINCDKFNKSMTSVKKIIFDDFFNQSVNFLPNTITHITFGYKFN